MYVGIYRLPKEDDIEMEIEFAKDEHIGWENKFVIAAYCARQDYKEFDGTLGPEVKDYLEDGKHYYQQLAISAPDWDALSNEKKDVWTMVAYLIDTNYIFRVKPIEFVRFDEELYQTLVDHKCAVSRKGLPGRVALDAASLHQYF